MNVSEAFAEVIDTLNRKPVDAFNGARRDILKGQMKMPPQMLALPVEAVADDLPERERVLRLMVVAMAAVRAELDRMAALR